MKRNLRNDLVAYSKVVRLLKKLLLILSLISAGSRLAAEGEQAYPVSWDMVGGAGGYRVELQNSVGDTLLSKVVAKDVLQYTFRLQPGNYRFRVTTLSVAMLDEGATQWFPVVVEAPAAPQIADIRPRELATDKDQVVTISGRHFSRAIKVQLIDPSGKKSPLQTRNVGLASMQILIPSLALAGNYGILMMNGDAFTTIEAKALTVAYPAPVFGSLAPAEIRLGVDQASFSAKADKLAASPEVVLIRSGSDPSIAANRVPVAATVGAGRLDVSLDPATAAGDYDVYVINHIAEAPALVGRVKLLPAPAPKPIAAEPAAAPEPAEPAVASAPPAASAAPLPDFPGHKFLAALGWSYGLPLTDWGGIYGPTPKSAFLRLDYFLSPLTRPSSGSAWNFALGLDTRYVGFSDVVDFSLVPSSLTSFSFAINPSATWSLHALSVRARLGCGLAYSILSSTPPTGGSAGTTDSFDLLASGELGLEFPIMSRVRLGLAFDYEHLFLTQGMDLLGISTYATFDF